MGQEARLEFKTLKFYDEKDNIKIIFLRNYSLKIKKEELNKIGTFKIDPKQNNTLIFKGIAQKRVEKRFMFLLTEAFKDITNIFTKKQTVYIHQNSGIPLIGTRFFGIQDRGSTLLEVKPITGCNAGCTFCSVDEGIGSKKAHDIVVEREYLVNETKKILEYKKKKGMHIYINVQGEPLLYYDIVNLVKDLKEIKYVEKITIISNGMLLTEKLVEELSDAGLTTLNISVSAINDMLAKEIMGTSAYNIKKIKEMLTYTVKNAKFKTIITPVFINGVNEEEMDSLIEFSKEIGCEIKIQKFCTNKAGRNPVKEISWEPFYKKLQELEEKYDIKLKEEIYKLEKTKEYPCPFRKGELVEAKIVCPGRYKYEKIAVAKERCIVIPSCRKESGVIKVKILSSKHNLITGRPPE